MVKKTITYTMFAIVIIVAFVIFSCNAIVVNHSNGKIYNSVDEIPETRYGMLLGTTPQSRFNGEINYFFQYRIEAAETLYKANKIQYLIISGDEESLDGINEPECMKDSLVARGIPEFAIILDGKGFRTIDSVVRLAEVFNVNSVTIISQQFHNERALFLAEKLYLDINELQAFNAKSPMSKTALLTYVREYFARVKMFLDILKQK